MRGAVLVLATWLAGSVAPAYAQTERDVGAAISVPEGRECLTHDEIASMVASWLGRDRIDEQLSILIEGGDERSAAFVVLRGGRPAARRVFEALPAQCAEARAVLTLAIALAIDATLLESLAITVAPAHEDHPRRVTRRHRRVGRRRHIGLGAALEGGVAFGLLPETTAIAGVSAMLEVDHGWGVRLGAFATPRVDIALGRGTAGSQLLLARLDGCLLGGDVLGLEACAGVAVGSLSAEGRGYDAPRASDLAWAGALARLALRWPRRGWVFGRLAVDVHAALRQPVLQVLDSAGNTLDRRALPRAGAAVTLALEVRLR